MQRGKVLRGVVKVPLFFDNTPKDLTSLHCLRCYIFTKMIILFGFNTTEAQLRYISQLLEVKLSYDLVCPLVGHLDGQTVG